MEKLGRRRGGGLAAGWYCAECAGVEGVQYKAVQPVVIVTGGCRECRGCNRYMGGAWGVQGGCKGYRGPETNIFSLPYFFNTFMPSCPVMFRFMFR